MRVSRYYVIKNSAIQTISDSEWNQIPKGAPYPSRADTTLLQGSGPQVYVMAGCQRQWIPDPDTFNARGYHWDAIQHVSDADLTAIPEGAQLPVQKAVPSAITVYNGGGYVARCTIEYDLGGQHQTQSSGNFDNSWQPYKVVIPVGATNIHVKCEDYTGLVWAEWKTVLDQTYPTLPQDKTFTLTGTTLSPGFMEKAPSRGWENV